MRNRVWAERDVKRPLFFVCAALVFLVAAVTATGAVSKTAASPPPEPAKNPPFPSRCGLNVILVLDESGSIGTSKATDQVKNAARAFLTPLAGTGSKVAVVEFSTAAHLGVAYQTVTAETIASKFEPYLKNEYSPAGWTNWEDALLLSKKTSDAQPKADLVVFVTDGDPTAYNEGSGQKTNTSNTDALNKAIPQANAIKNDGIKIFGVGVGSALNNTDSQNRLKKISGPNVATGDNVAGADVIFVQDFGALASNSPRSPGRCASRR